MGVLFFDYSTAILALIAAKSSFSRCVFCMAVRRAAIDADGGVIGVSSAAEMRKLWYAGGGTDR